MYIPVLSLFLISCTAQIHYIGKSLPATTNIDIYISEQSIKKPYEYIGKGYLGFYRNQNGIQKKAEEIARKMALMRF